MSIRWGRPWRRPRTRSLAALYDQGWNAPEGAASPFQPPQERGDSIRHWLWSQGAEDRSLARTIAELI